MAAIPVQRWMLHQQLWGLFLRIHRSNISSLVGRASCQLLAQNIINTQTQIQARCAVCGSLSISDTQVFNAAVVLLIDLLFPSVQNDAEDSSAQLSRIMTRDKIREAIELLRAKDVAERSSSQFCRAERGKGSAQRAVIALEALMELEQNASAEIEESNGRNPAGSGLGRQNNDNTKSPVKARAIDILKTLNASIKCNNAPKEQGIGTNSSLPSLISTPYPNFPDNFPDLNVLPVLSSDLGPSFWQFLDFPPNPPEFPTKNDFLATSMDWQNMIGLLPVSPVSGTVESMNGLGVPRVTDICNSSSTVHLTHPSPLSLESEAIELGRGSESATTPSSADSYVAARLYYGMPDGTVSSS
jgi:hypothetical protein